MAKDNQQPKKRAEGLWIRNGILNIRALDDSEKMLLAHFDSFGAKGCYQANSTLAEIFMAKSRTIRRRIAKINKAGLIYIKSPKGYYRTIWVKSNSDVKEAVKLWYRGKEIDKPNNQDGQIWPTKGDKTGQVSRPKSVFRHGQICPPTYTETSKETKKETIATPAPLPAGGQAPALLGARKAETIARIEQLKRDFGKGGRQRVKLTDAEWEQSRQKNINSLKALRIDEAK